MVSRNSAGVVYLLNMNIEKDVLNAKSFISGTTSLSPFCGW